MVTLTQALVLHAQSQKEGPRNKLSQRERGSGTRNAGTREANVNNRRKLHVDHGTLICRTILGVKNNVLHV
jgi:hypothetical protein